MKFPFSRYKRVSGLEDANGNVIVSGVHVSNTGHKAALPEGPSLYRGFKFDLTMTVGGTQIDLDLDGQAVVNGKVFRVHTFPEGNDNRPSILIPGVDTPWGKVIEVTYNDEDNLWAVKTKVYPEGVIYRPRAAIIVATRS